MSAHAIHISEDIYRQIAEYIEENSFLYMRGWHSETDQFTIDDVCFETDDDTDGYQCVSVTAKGLIHYTRNTSDGEFSRDFDSIGQCWCEAHTYDEDGTEIPNDFNSNLINKFFK